MGNLYIIGTPIGNLKDITLRALEVLKESDFVFSEDTRVTKKLLSHYEIHTQVKRYNESSPLGACKEIEILLQEGKNVAFVSDAGTPGISDPGAVLVKYISEALPACADRPEAKIIPIPGPSAVITALSASGIFANQFVFLGFPPQKNKRQKFFKEILDIKIRPVVLYESPHRLQKTLDNLIEVFGMEQKIIIFKELTKIFEDKFSGSLQDAKNYFTGEKARGEFVLIIP